jgi:hypothetical protein
MARQEAAESTLMTKLIPTTALDPEAALVKPSPSGDI